MDEKYKHTICTICHMQLDVAYDSIYSAKAKINYMCHMKITCIQWLQKNKIINDF
jgi:hypothetical protein